MVNAWIAAVLLSVPSPARAGNGSSRASGSVDVNICSKGTAKIAFTANPTKVPKGGSTTLSWSSDISGLSFSISGLGPVSGGQVVVKPAGDVGQQTTYTISGAGGGSCGAEGSASVTVTIRAVEVLIEGSRISHAPSILNYMMTPGMYCVDCIGGALLGTSQHFADSRAAPGAATDFDAFIADVRTWGPSVQAAQQAHVGGNAYMVDEFGNVLGHMPTSSIYNTGIPGLSYLGDPYNTGGKNKLYVGDAPLVINGVSYDVVGYLSASPIILDLDGDGKPDVDRGEWLPHPTRFNKSRSVLFDITAIGFPNVTEWIGPRDGLLVAPLKPGESVHSGANLFGNAIGWTDGYQKLFALFDKDKNGWIEGDELKGFMVWRDLNGNGRVDPGELKSVQAYGITRISDEQENLKSTFVMNGKERSTWDWWPTSMLVYPTPVAMAPQAGAER